jgi:hypothetical protein
LDGTPPSHLLLEMLSFEMTLNKQVYARKG